MRLNRQYLAGLFDGRGQIEFAPNGVRIGIRVSGDLPKKLQREFGGSCFEYQGKLWWRLQEKRAMQFLGLILPYLKVKQKEVKEILYYMG